MKDKDVLDEGKTLTEQDDEWVIAYLRRAQRCKDVYDLDEEIYSTVLREFFKRGLDERDPELGV